MKHTIGIMISIAALSTACSNENKTTATESESESESPVVKVAKPIPGKHLFLDVHNLEPGKVKFEGVAEAHKKDLATEGKFDVNFIKYWVDEAQGKVYCLVEAPDSASVSNTHKEAHGLLPDRVSLVAHGDEASITDPSSLYFDVHHLGAGKVNAAAVAEAHQKDLATQGKFDVKFINYWVDEKSGVVVCLSEAKNPDNIIKTHKAAHGLVPDEVHKVQQGE